MWAAVFATAEATVTLQCGSSSSTFTVNKGVNQLKIPLAAGQMTVKMVRNGKTIINETPPSSEYTYNLHPVLCTFFFFSLTIGSSCLTHTHTFFFFIWGFLDNYNAWVGSAGKGSLSLDISVICLNSFSLYSSSMNNWHLENRLNVEKLFQLQRQFSLTDLSFFFFL